MRKITAFLSDEHTVLRKGLRLLLRAMDDINVISEAEAGHRAVGKKNGFQPDVVLLDIAMPSSNGEQVAQLTARGVPATRVLTLSIYSGDEHLQQAVAANTAGCLVKETASKDLLRAIRQACKGNAFFSPPIARGLLKQWPARDPQSRSMARKVLTRRRTEVVRWLAHGHSIKQIARLLARRKATVAKDRQRLLDKLQIPEVASLDR